MALGRRAPRRAELDVAHELAEAPLRRHGPLERVGPVELLEQEALGRRVDGLEARAVAVVGHAHGRRRVLAEAEVDAVGRRRLRRRPGLLQDRLGRPRPRGAAGVRAAGARDEAPVVAVGRAVDPAQLRRHVGHLVGRGPQSADVDADLAVEERVHEQRLVVDEVLRVLVVGLEARREPRHARVPVHEAPPRGLEGVVALPRRQLRHEAAPRHLEPLVQEPELLQEARVRVRVAALRLDEGAGLVEPPLVLGHEVGDAARDAPARAQKAVEQHRLARAERLVDEGDDLLDDDAAARVLRVEERVVRVVVPGEREVAHAVRAPQVRQLAARAVDNISNLVELDELRVLARLAVGDKDAILDARRHGLDRAGAMLCPSRGAPASARANGAPRRPPAPRRCEGPANGAPRRPPAPPV